ncbi:MAG: response regulator, partial [Desulfocapsa sp.]|nr:response regulator [Desulfocapsa sp.]
MILLRLLYAVIGMFTASLLLAFFFSSVLNKIVSRPILALADTMDRVHQEKNYSIRAKKTSRDEIGVLVEGVNSMLEGIEQRDEQLLVAKEIAENANLAKSQFLAQMSHEIRTPMNGVLGIASLLLHTSLNEKQTNFVHTIRTSGESLLGLINDILDSSKIEAGKLELELISFNIRHMAEETVDLLSKHASEKNVNLACVVSTDVPAYVKGDPGRLRQIFMNLLGNALKFTSYGEVILYISEEKRDNDDVYLRFEIKDSGIGVNKNKQKEIFVAFSQVDESTTRKFGGTGLGLAICRSLVHLMGGTIGIESEEGKGSVFWFTVMLGMGSTSDAIVGLPPEETFFQKFDAFVLVVEDNITNQIVAQGTLEKMGCKVELAGNGLEAVSAVEENQYDLIFMDCQMPVMDGYE